MINILRVQSLNLFYSNVWSKDVKMEEQYIKIEQMTNEEILEEYNRLLRTVRDVREKEFIEYELRRLNEIEHEMTRREE